MQAVSDLSNEELRLQRSHFIIRLYGWSRFLLTRRTCDAVTYASYVFLAS